VRGYGEYVVWYPGRQAQRRPQARRNGGDLQHIQVVDPVCLAVISMIVPRTGTRQKRKDMQACAAGVYTVKRVDGSQR